MKLIYNLSPRLVVHRALDMSVTLVRNDTVSKKDSKDKLFLKLVLWLELRHFSDKFLRVKLTDPFSIAP